MPKSDRDLWQFYLFPLGDLMNPMMCVVALMLQLPATSATGETSFDLFKRLIEQVPVTAEGRTIISLYNAHRLRVVIPGKLEVVSDPLAWALTTVDSSVKPPVVVMYFDGAFLLDPKVPAAVRKCVIIHEGSHVLDLTKGVVPESLFYTYPEGYRQSWTMDSLLFETEGRAYLAQGTWAVRLGVASEHWLTKILQQQGEVVMRETLARHKNLYRLYPSRRTTIERMVRRPSTWGD